LNPVKSYFQKVQIRIEMRNLVKTLCLTLALISGISAFAQVPKLSSYSSATAVIYLDFDGHRVAGTSWNTDSVINCQPAAVSNTQINEIFNRISEDYRPFNINITTDSTVFLAAAIGRRMRVIFTPTHLWYTTIFGNAGGVAYTGSFKWVSEAPCFVFSNLLGNNTKNLAEAGSHESGHTMGLTHQSFYAAGCVKTEYYSGVGSGEIGWAPIMGTSYSRNLSTWHKGTASSGCTDIQDDISIIAGASNGFGFRTDDYGNTAAASSALTLVSNSFSQSGLVSQSTDKDVFRFNITASHRLTVNAIPYNVGTNNAGSNIDIQIALMNTAMDTVAKYNPSVLLNVGVDTTLTAGTYYLVIDGVGNMNTSNSDYGSLGFYTFAGSITPASALPLRRLELSGVAVEDKHALNWLIDADEPVKKMVLEASTDGRNFVPVTNPANGTSRFQYKPLSTGAISYRLRVTFINDLTYYSNIAAIRAVSGGRKTELLSNTIQDVLVVTSKGNYSYQLMDFAGKTVQTGRLTAGINRINAASLAGGMYIIRFAEGAEQWTERLIIQ
jgi:hypothetical protein